MTIRPIRLADRWELIRMRQALWPDSTSEEAEEILVSSGGDRLVLVDEGKEDHLVGFAEVGLRTFADGCDTCPVAYLEGIWVDPGHRRSGIADELLEHCEKWARDLGRTEFASDCEVGNEASRAFHEALGFREVQRTINFRKDLHPPRA